MRIYILILFFGLISSSKFFQKSKKIIKDENFLIMNFLKKLNNSLFDIIEKEYKELTYKLDNGNIEKIVKDYEEASKKAAIFFKEHNLNNIYYSEMKIIKQINEGFKFNLHKIEHFLIQNKFPENISKMIKEFISKYTLNNFTNFKSIISELKSLKKKIQTQPYDDSIKETERLNKKFIKNELKIFSKELQNEIISLYNKTSNFFENNIIEIIKNIKLIYRILKPIFVNEKKYNDFTIQFKNFFIIQKLSSKEDFDNVLKYYSLIKKIINLKDSLLLKKQLMIYHDFNIFMNGNNKDIPYYNEFIIFIKKFFKMSLKDIIIDFKKSISLMKKLTKQIINNEISIEKYYKELNDKTSSFTDEIIRKFSKAIIDFMSELIKYF